MRGNALLKSNDKSHEARFSEQGNSMRDDLKKIYEKHGSLHNFYEK